MMTTKLNERMELVEPDQYTGSPSRGRSAEEWTTYPLHAPPGQEKGPQERIKSFPEPRAQSIPSAGEGETTQWLPEPYRIRDPLSMQVPNPEETGRDPVQYQKPDPLSLREPNPEETGRDPVQYQKPDPLSLQVLNQEETRRNPVQNRKQDPLSLREPYPVQVRIRNPLSLPAHAPCPDEPRRQAATGNDRSWKRCIAEFEACYSLRKQGWTVSHCEGIFPSADLIAVRADEVLLLMVRGSRQPVPDAHAVFLRYHDRLARLRSLRCPGFVRKEAWVLAPPDGWHYYEVLPGGIRRVRREEGRTGPGPGEEEPFWDARVPQPLTPRGEAG